MADQKLPDCWVVVKDRRIVATHDAPGHYDGIEAVRYVPAQLLDDLLSLLEDVPETAAIEVMHHIRTMYPDALKAVPKTAATSIRNTIIAETERYIRRSCEAIDIASKKV